jgi:hypothetical protein
MVDTLSPNMQTPGLGGPHALPIDAGIMFADHKGVHKPRIEKKQLKLVEKVTFLKEFLEDGEQLLAVTTAVSPTSFLEQWTTGFIFVYVKRCILVFTDRRVFHIPTTSSFDYRGSVAEFRYGDLDSIAQKGSRLKVAYKSGNKEVFLYIRGSERKKIRKLLQSTDLFSAPGGAGERVHRCPKCTQTLEADRFDCPSCAKEFKSRTKARNLSLWLPGGGYFYTGHPYLGVIDAAVEILFLAVIISSLIPSAANPDGDLALAAIFAVFLAIEKAITVYHANHFVKEYLPVEGVEIRRRPLRMVLGAIGMVFVLGFVGLGVLGVLMDTGYAPSERVVSASELPDGHYEELVAEGIIEQGELIEYFYSEGILSIIDGGSILTNYRVIAYERHDDGAISHYFIPNDEIASVTLLQEGDALNYSVYQVSTADEGSWLNLVLPHEHGDAERFADAVRAKIGQ